MKNYIKKTIYILAFIFAFSLFMGLSTFTSLVKANNNDLQINIDTLGYDLSGLPKGVKGKSYPVFDASVVDETGNYISEVSVLIFFDANGDTYQGNVEDDVIVTFENGRFPTAESGVYVIEYSAELNGENKIIRVFIEALSNNVPIDYAINNEIVANAFTGEKVYLPEGRMTYDKRFGVPNLEVKVFLDYNKETCKQVTYFDYGKPYFLPRVSGVYTLEYSATNILGEAEKVVKTKQITIEDKGEPIIEAPSLSMVAHVGDTIVFPEVESIEYSNGKIYYLPTTVYVNGQECVDRKYTPSESGKISVAYSSTGKISKKTANTDVQEISVENLKDKVQTATNKQGKLFIDNYFNKENFKTEFVNSKLRFIVETGNSKATFKNAIPVEKLQLAFIANAKGTIFNNAKLILQDSVDSSERIEFTFRENQEISDGIDVYLNGDKCCGLSNTSFINRDKGEIVFRYKDGSFTLSNADLGKINALKYVDGGLFKSFSSGKVYISFELNDVQSESYFELITLAENVIKFMSRDTTYPVFIQEKDFEAKKGEKGDVVVFNKPAAFDLLDASPRVYIEIIAPDGSYVANFDEDEIIDKYIFTANLSGTYYIRYQALDNQGNDCIIEANSLFIADRQSPIVISTPKLPTIVALNERVLFENVKFKDNVTSKCKTYIYVIFGNYEKHLVEDNKYIFKKAGVYKVIYGAVDTAGNKTEVIYNVTCK